MSELHLTKIRKYITPKEFDILYKTISTHKSFAPTRQRDKVIVLLSYRHGLRASEAASLKWTDLNLNDHRIHVYRLKNGKPSTHPLQNDEVIQLSKLKREYKDKNCLGSPLFLTSRYHLPITRATLTRLYDKFNKLALLETKISPHTLRHSCGYYLINQGHSTRVIQDYLGHRNIQNTEAYTELAVGKFDTIRW